MCTSFCQLYYMTLIEPGDIRALYVWSNFQCSCRKVSSISWLKRHPIKLYIEINGIVRCRNSRSYSAHTNFTCAIRIHINRGEDFLWNIWIANWEENHVLWYARPSNMQRWYDILVCPWSHYVQLGVHGTVLLINKHFHYFPVPFISYMYRSYLNYLLYIAHAHTKKNPQTP